MAFYFSIPIVIAAALFQSSSSQAGPLSGLKPDLVVVIVAMAGLLLPFRKALILAFIGGTVLDVFSGFPLGFATMLLLLIAAISSLPNRDVVEVNPLVCIALVAVVTVFYYLAYSLAMVALAGPLEWPSLLQSEVLPSLVINSLLSPVAFVWFRLLSRRRVKLREEWL